MAQQKLTATPRPPFGFRILMETGPLPYWEGVGDVDFLCGKCGAVLAEKNPKEYPFREFVFRCHKCGSYNRVPGS